MGAVTVKGNAGYAGVSISDGLIATNLQYDGKTLTDIYYENNPITSFKGAALNVSTTGINGGDVYLELDDTVAGAITLSTGKIGGAYATLVVSDITTSQVFKSIEHQYGDYVYTDTELTATGAAIKITSESGDRPTDITPGEAYIQFLDYIYSDLVLGNTAFSAAWGTVNENNISLDQQKSFTFISDLFLSSQDQRGDLGSYYNETNSIFSQTIVNDANPIGAFLVLADSASGAITSTAKGGSNIVVLYDALVVGQYKGDIETYPIYNNETLIDYEIVSGTDSLTGAAVSVKGNGAFFSATANSVLGALTVDGGAGDAYLFLEDSFIASTISITNNGAYNFGTGTVKVSGQAANVTLSNTYLSTLNLQGVKGASIINLYYDDNPLENDYGFISNPEKIQINLKAKNNIVDNINISGDSSLSINMSGFEWGSDLINNTLDYTRMGLPIIDFQFEFSQFDNSIFG
jgi:hypothetical protein